jgi:hypothetical protein
MGPGFTFLSCFSKIEVLLQFYPSYALVKERFPAFAPTASRGTDEKIASSGRLLLGVELIGFEPTTSSLQSWRSPS